MRKQQRLKLLAKTKAAAKVNQTQERQERSRPAKFIKDERFERVSYDPRFLKVPKNINKVKTDERFSRMMTDDSFKLVTKVDKYGRKIKPTKINQQLKQFYYQDGDSDGNEPMDLEAAPQELPKGHDRDIHQWMQNYSEQSSQTDAEMEEESEQSEKELWSEDDENVVKGEDVEATKRLAMCNYDWMNISSKDIMLLFNSFKPKTGSIIKVEVFPSEIGIKKLAEEEARGPQNIWNEQDEVKQKARPEQGKESIDPEKLREYERERLKYFYAIITCDSKETAQEIYKMCDGKEFENQGLLDLRFVPDELTFPHAPKQVCEDLPAKGEVKGSINRAVGHSSVKLTWQDPQLNTIAGLKKKNWAKMTEKELADVDWSLYLNNDDVQVDGNQQNHEEAAESISEVDDIELPAWKQQYHKKNRSKKPKQELEIVFSSGFNIAEKITAKNEEKKMSSFELYKKKRKQKRAEILEEKRIEKAQRKEEMQQQQQAQRDYEKERSRLELLVDKRKKQQFVANVDDPRFAQVYKNPLYNIDTTSPHFKVTKNTKFLGAVVKRKRGTAQ